jgi:hypothetical protein
MSFNSVPLLATGDWIDAAWGNTYWRDNMAALWPYTTAGDVAYAVSASGALGRLALTVGGMLYGGASAPAWLAKPGVDAILKNTSAGVPSWLALSDTRIKTKTHYNATGHTYNSTTERDMPNSSNTIVVAVTSTIIMLARVVAANSGGTNCWNLFATSIDATVGNFSNFNYGNGISIPNVCIGMKTGVTAGTKTLKIREKEGYGAGLAYAVANLEWIALAIPE